MTLDDQIKDELQALTARLRSEIDRQVQSTVAMLSAAAQADRERAVSEARSAAADAEIAAAGARHKAHADGHATGRDTGHRDGVAEGRKQAEQEGRWALDAAVTAAAADAHATGKQLGRGEAAAEARQQAEQERAAHDAAAGAAIAEARTAGKAEGRQEGVADGRHQVEEERREALEASTLELGASERLAVGVRAIDAARTLSETLDALVDSTGHQAARAGIWLVRGGRFSSWRVTGFGPGVDNDLDNRSLDLLPDDAGMIAEAARRNTVMSGGADDAGPPSFAGTTPVRASVAVPIAMSGQVVAVLYADEGSGDPPARLLNPAAVEVLARHAARCLEALTAFKAARALTERPGRSDTTATPTTDEGAGSADEVSARRYARLLVSEIKLYHESAVVDGRRDRDLATRLGGEIAHARVLYEQRVPADVRRRTDFFRDELVRTLADGDSGLLPVKT